MGILYIVATPIGNLKDITLRALETLQAVDLIAAEDTRVAKKLLNAHGINKPVVSYHQHNAAQRDSEILAKLKSNADVALITDAGTPLVSDPGHSLVAHCRENKIQVTPIPGVSAVITALSVNDFTASRFVFEGFLPPKKSARIERLKKLALLEYLIILYEAKHRIVNLLEDLEVTFGQDRDIMIARELTKIHEQIISGTVSEIKQKIEDQTIPCKGEFVILLNGASAGLNLQAEEDRMKLLYSKITPFIAHKEAVDLGVKFSELPKNSLYRLASEFYEDN
ncbi:MAG: 16S rRNA (cytidine(1402)-2'-O)-methyltransferase [Pseudomonadota bacterium]